MGEGPHLRRRRWRLAAVGVLGVGHEADGVLAQVDVVLEVERLLVADELGPLTNWWPRKNWGACGWCP
jgi:hypothetical protein